MDAAGETVKSLKAVAERLGVSRQVVYKWSERADWPFKGAKFLGRYPVQAIRQWRAAHLTPTPEEAIKNRLGGAPHAKSDRWAELGLEARVKLLVMRAAKLEIEKGILAGEYVRKDDRDRAEIRRIQEAKAALLSLPRAIAPLLKGIDDEKEIEALLEKQIRETLENLSRGVGGGGDAAPAAS